MTLREGLGRLKAQADRCASTGKASPVRQEAVEALDSRGASWRLFYKEDWPVHHMDTSRLGKMRPVVHAVSSSGSRLVLDFDRDRRRWTLVPAMVTEADAAAAMELEAVEREWNALLEEAEHDGAGSDT